MKKLPFATALTTTILLLLSMTGLLLQTGSISDHAVSHAKAALEEYTLRHPQEHPSFLAIVDYTKPSYLKRMVIVNLKTGARSYYRVAHGKRSGELFAHSFSNEPGSGMSSLGLYKVINVYNGSHGKALRLEGLDSLRNSSAFGRDVVLHAASYVSISYILLNLVTFNGPRIGRSDGCFVVSFPDIEKVTANLGRGGFIYAYAALPSR